MPRIDYAWSLELNEPLTAYEAHERYLQGVISDKTKFECMDPNCDAQITCANMDKYQYQMKVRTYFKAYGRHSEKCQVCKKADKVVYGTNKEQREEFIAGKENVVFNIFRPEEQSPKKQSKEDGSEGLCHQTINKSKTKSEALKNINKRSSQLYLLSTLVGKYIVACKDNTEDSTYIKLAFDKEMTKYKYKLSSLFIPIEDSEYDTARTWKTQVFYGKGRIYKKDDEYWINFNSHLKNSIKPVRCVINKDIIENTRSKLGGLKNLERFMTKGEVYCFVMGKIKETPKTIFVNVSTLDHIAFTDEDIKRLDDIETE